MAALGAALARGGDFRDVFAIVRRPDWHELRPSVGDAYGALRLDDL